MSLADPDALECRLCGEEFVGPDRREQYRAHRAEQHPAGETGGEAVRAADHLTEADVARLGPKAKEQVLAVVPPAGQAATPGKKKLKAVVVDGRYPCPDCTRIFENAQGVTLHHTRAHKKLGGNPGKSAPKVSGQAVGKTAITSSTARGSTPAAVPPPDPAPTSDGELVRPAPDVPPVTLTGGVLTFMVSVDVGALPESLDAVVDAIRAALSGLGR